ncbi:PTS sugar transporter subunit IIC, partial [Staphylococcus aureus]|uniref:PTS sugar transporter subunit IIC n=1 Tax=Staphylococcus aureus TaxID=1280 RepID=UPI0037DA3A90
MVTTPIPNILNPFTQLQPILITIFISILFTLIIISPLSTLPIPFPIPITPLPAPSPSIPISPTQPLFIIPTTKLNRLPLPLSLFFPPLKIIIPNILKYP